MFKDLFIYRLIDVEFVFWVNLGMKEGLLFYVDEWESEIVEVEKRLWWFVFYIVEVFFEMKDVKGMIEFLFFEM